MTDMLHLFSEINVDNLSSQRTIQKKVMYKFTAFITPNEAKLSVSNRVCYQAFCGPKVQKIVTMQYQRLPLLSIVKQHCFSSLTKTHEVLSLLSWNIRP